MDVGTLAVAALPAFIASAVEFVEATTIILAVGVTRGWRAPLYGTIAAALTLVPSMMTSSSVISPSFIKAARLLVSSRSRNSPLSRRNSDSIVCFTPTPPQIQR